MSLHVYSFSGMLSISISIYIYIDIDIHIYLIARVILAQKKISNTLGYRLVCHFFVLTIF